MRIWVIVAFSLLPQTASPEYLVCKEEKSCAVLAPDSSANCTTKGVPIEISWSERSIHFSYPDLEEVLDFDSLGSEGTALVRGHRVIDADSPLQTLVVFNDFSFVLSTAARFANLDEYSPYVVFMSGRCEVKL